LWALPGGFMDMEETPEQCAVRELKEETSVEHLYLEQLYTFGAIDRDPRGRNLSVAYFALIDSSKVEARAGDDAQETAWHSVYDLPVLAFDHHRIVDYALERLRNKAEYTTVSFQMLPDEFTLSELQSAYQAILKKELDKRNFRRKMIRLDILEETGNTRRRGLHRPARLYRFKQENFEKLKDRGIVFPF
jgi:8-oxo-dGTP diphosphatase